MSITGVLTPVTYGVRKSAANSTNASLGGNASFVGTTEDVTDFTGIDITLAGGPSVAPGDLYFEFSPDGTNWDISVQVGGTSLSGPNITPFHLRVVQPFFRVRYVNGSTALTYFRLTTILHRGGASRLTRFLNQVIDPAEGVELNRSIINGRKQDGSFDHIAIANDKSLMVTVSGSSLPTGAATEATLGTRLADATITTRLNTLGQKTMAASAPVVLASDQTAIPITGSLTATNPSVGVNNTAAPGSSTQIGGPDGAGKIQAAQVLASNPGGSEEALVTRNIPSGTQPVSASSLPLPSGAATEATLSTRLADATLTARLNTLGQKTMASSAPVVIASDQGAVPITGTVTANLGTVDGLALDATLTNGTQQSIVRGGAKGATAAATLTSTAEGADHQALDVATYFGGAAVDPRAVRALTSADVVTANQGTNPWTTDITDRSGRLLGHTTVDSSALPTGAATEATLGTRLADSTFTGRINTQGQKTMAASTPVVFASDQSRLPVSTEVQLDYDSGAGTQNLSLIGLALPGNGGAVAGGTSANPIRFDPVGTTVQPISAAALPLPSGAATEATLATRLADATFTGRINTQGQKTMAASTPVVIASDQSALPISGTVTANLGTVDGLALDATLTGGTVKSIARGGQKGATNTNADITHTAEGADHEALDVQLYHGGSAIDPRQIRALTNSDIVKAQLQDNAGSAITLGQKTMASSVPVVLASDESTLPISAASLPLPTGAATEATLATRLADATFTGRINTQGQKAMAASTPVVIASDQSTLPISGTVTANLGTVDGLALDATLTGGTAKSVVRGGQKGATNTNADITHTAEGSDHEALDVQLYHSGAAIDPRQIRALVNTDIVKSQLQDNAGTAITLGQKTMASSVPVVLASDESTLPISAASLPLPTGAATEATLATRLADATFTGRINTQGQKTMAASTPVVIASDQSTFPITGKVNIDQSTPGTSNAVTLVDAFGSVKTDDLVLDLLAGQRRVIELLEAILGQF